MSVAPHNGYRNERLHIVVDGLRQDLGTSPTVFFSVPYSGTIPPAEVVIDQSSVRQTGPGQYEFGIAISSTAQPREYMVILTKQVGLSDAAGAFTVRYGYRAPFVLTSRDVTLALTPSSTPTPATGGPPPVAAMPSKIETADGIAERILSAEAEILAAISDAAATHAHDPCWLSAAAAKERSAAKVIRAIRCHRHKCCE